MSQSWTLLAESFQGLDQLLKLYREVDTAVGHFKAITGLDCIQHCKKCCQTPAENIETTLFEIFPLSIYLWRSGKAEYWLQKITRTVTGDPCLFSRPENLSINIWGCTYYQWRPLICRLFGFAATLDKKGQPVFSPCKVLKTADPTAEAKIKKLTIRGTEVHIYRYYAAKVTGLNPSYQLRYPINEAFQQGLKIVGLKLSYLNDLHPEVHQKKPA